MPDVSPRATANALDPERMSPEERLREVGEILAAGLLRLRASGRQKVGTAERVPWTSPPGRASIGGNAGAEKSDE